VVITASMQQSVELRSIEKNNSTTLRKEVDTIIGEGLTLEIISKPNRFWTMNTGLDYYQDKINSNANDINTLTKNTTIKRGLYPNDASYKSTSLFNLHQFKIDKLTFETGLRYNFINIKLTDITLGNIKVTPSAMVYNVGIHYQIKKYNQLYSSIASGYRAPNIDDMGTLGIVDFRYEIPEYDLKPEKSLNLELGYKLNYKYLQFNLSIYQMQLRDIITRVKVDGQVINGYNVYNKQNIESSFIKGAEARIIYRLANNILLSSNANYTYGQNLTKKEPMRRIPPFFGQNKIELNQGLFQFSLTHQYAGKQFRLAQGDIDDNRIGKLGTPQWNTFNAEAIYNQGHLTIKTGFINILNEKYKTHGSGIYGMGRALSAIVQWKF
jgi:outer membrane receptor protein involved in Fe transport